MVFVDAAFNFIVDLVLNGGYGIIFLLMAIESSFIPFPSEAILPPAGYLASTGDLSFTLIMVASTLGILAGAFVNYIIGLYGGRKFIERYGKYLLISEDHLDKSENYFEKHGEITIFTARLIPAIRQLISIPAGWSKMNLKKFTVYTTLGGGIWNFILTYFGFVFGENWRLIEQYSTQLDIIAVVLIVIVLAYYFWKK